MGTEFSRPLESVEGLKLSIFPQLARAQEAIVSGDDRAALETLQEVRGKADTPWLQQWVNHRLTGVYDRLNMPLEAVDTFLLLVNQAGVQVFLFVTAGFGQAHKR